MIDNKHSILEIPGSALYLMDYFESMGYDVVLHEDWEDLGKILTESPDYQYPMDPGFTKAYLHSDTPAFALYLKRGDEVVATYAAKSHHPRVIAENLDEFYPDLVVQELPEILDRSDLSYWYSSCQWVHTDHLGKKLGVSLDLLKKHIIFDGLESKNHDKVDVNFAIHKINDSMKTYHIDKLAYSSSEPFAIKKEGAVGGAGSEEDREYNIVWTLADTFQSKLSDIKAGYK